MRAIACAVVAAAAARADVRSRPRRRRSRSATSRRSASTHHRCGAPDAEPPVGRLRLGRLTSSANLRSPIVHRESAVELDTYETLRWTENPEDYVRRSLSRALFDDGRLEEVVGGAAVTLDVEVVAFEEARRENRHVGRVQLGYQLHDERLGPRERRRHRRARRRRRGNRAGHRRDRLGDGRRDVGAGEERRDPAARPMTAEHRSSGAHGACNARAVPPDVDELEFLSNAALALGEIGPDEDLFRVVAEQLAPLAPESLVITIAYDASAGFIAVRALVGPEDMQQPGAGGQRRSSRAGLPCRRGGATDPGRGQARARRRGACTSSPSGTGPSSWPQRFEARLGIRSVYGQPFSRKGDFLGAVAFVSRAPSLEHVPAHRGLRPAGRRRHPAPARRGEASRERAPIPDARRELARRDLPAAARAGAGVRVRQSRGVSAVRPHPGAALRRRAARGAVPVSRELDDGGGASRAPERARRCALSVARTERTCGRSRTSRRCATRAGASSSSRASPATSPSARRRRRRCVEADRRKTEFLAVLSHELRNPLGAISNSAYLLERAEPGGEQARRALAVIERQIVQLTRLIDDLLDVTRITRGKIQLKPERIELNELVRSRSTTTARSSRAPRSTIEVLPAPADVFDPRRPDAHPPGRRQPAPERREVHAARRASVGLGASGRGAQAGRRPRAQHRPAHRARAPRAALRALRPGRPHARSRQGRARARARARQGHRRAPRRGRWRCRATSRQGTAFTVRLPLDTTPAPKPVVPSLGASRPGRPTGACWSSRTTQMPRTACARSSSSTRTPSPSRARVRRASRWRAAFKPDVVLCDIGLPGMDGYEVARAMRADPELHDVALVALSGYASPEDVERSRRAGFDRHVSKPPDIEVLERVMSEVVRR